MSATRIPLVAAIDALLPQTQCTKCGTPGCLPYAEEIAAGAPHNRCVPGGADTIAELAALLGRPVLPLDPAYGVEPSTRRVAFIREAECIGCTKCLQACPVDAISGAAKLMHTIITAECTGCDLCIPPCPVDCIEIHDLPKITGAAEKRTVAAHNRMRFEAREARLAEEKRPAATTPAPASAQAQAETIASAPEPASDKSRVIAAAMARTRLKKAERQLAGARENGGDTQALEAEVQRLQEEVARLS